MALLAPTWMQNLTYTAAADRRLIGAMCSPGVLAGGLAVSQRAAGANMSVDVAVGSCVVEGTAGPGQGRYLCSSDAVANVALAASPASGQSRIDLIVATVRDSSVTGTDSDWILDKVTGTATTGIPAAPAVPSSSLALATVLVGGTVSSIVNANITDQRVQSGNPNHAGSLAVPPSFDGQLMTAAGHVYRGASGTWSRVDTPKVLTQSLTLASTTYGALSWASWAGSDSLAIAAPGYPCTARVDHTFSAAKNPGQFRVGLSGNGGTSWSYSAQVTANSTGPSDWSAIAVSYFADFDGAGQIKAVAQCNTSNVAGGVAVVPATYTLTVFPR